MFRSIVIFTLLVVVPVALPLGAGNTDDCEVIADDAKRLRCYDLRPRQADVDSDASETSGLPGIWNQRIQKDADRETFTLTARKPN